MHYLIYKITNKINKMFYIGAHSTNDINDAYFGSGKYLRRAIKKYGRKNFVKEILFECASEKEMYQKEAELVNDEFVKRSDTYNLTCGGCSGNMYGFYHDYLLSVFEFFIAHDCDFELTKIKTGYQYEYEIFIKSCRRIFPDRLSEIKEKPKRKTKRNPQIWMTNKIRLALANENTKQYFERFGFEPGKKLSQIPSEEDYRADQIFLINLKKDLKLILDTVIKNGYDVLHKYLQVPYTGSPTNFIHACRRYGIDFISQQGKSRSGRRKSNNVRHIIRVSQEIKKENKDDTRNSSFSTRQYDV